MANLYTSDIPNYNIQKNKNINLFKRIYKHFNNNINKNQLKGEMLSRAISKLIKNHKLKIFTKEI